MKIKKMLSVLLLAVMCCSSCSNSYDVSTDENGEMHINLSDEQSISLRKITAGEFKMGSYEGTGEEDELPVRDITITKDYYIGTFEITQAQWEAVMNNNPSSLKGADLPVESVSWKECGEFCKKLSDKTGLNVSMPTEAQWEYACRAGSDTIWFFGDNEEEFGKYANLDTDEKTYAGAKFQPNPNGLYNMYGNVMEWCLDYYGGEYPKDDLVDPTGCKSGDARVSRGGGWGMSPDGCRSAYRNACGENEKSDGIGLRIVVNEK